MKAIKFDCTSILPYVLITSVDFIDTNWLGTYMPHCEGDFAFLASTTQPHFTSDTLPDRFGPVARRAPRGDRDPPRAKSDLANHISHKPRTLAAQSHLPAKMMDGAMAVSLCTSDQPLASQDHLL